MSQAKLRKRGGPPPRAARPWLPLALLAGGVVVLAGLLLAVFAGRGGADVPVEVSGAPRLRVNQQKVDLGDVPLGQTVEVSFQLANVGDQTLWLTEAPYVRVAEGC